MLGDKVRTILSWVTVAVVAVMLLSAMANVVFWFEPEEAPSLQVVPAEASLCPGQEVTFSVEPPLEDVEWAATGEGDISEDGRYVAEALGDWEIRAAGPDGERGRAVVHVIPCTPTPTPTLTPTPAPTPSPTPIPVTAGEVDPQGDVATYGGGAPVGEIPSGIDVRNASVQSDGRVSLGTREGLPPDLAEWAQEGEVLLWIALYEPIPESLPVRTDWLFVLDLDNDTATGRRPGSGSIDPDLGDEVAMGIYYDPLGGGFTPYLLIWDPNIDNWQERSDAVRYWMSEDRTLVALAVSRETLEREVSQITGVTVAPEATVGRGGAVAYLEPQAVIDFYPDLPE